MFRGGIAGNCRYSPFGPGISAGSANQIRDRLRNCRLGFEFWRVPSIVIQNVLQYFGGGDDVARTVAFLAGPGGAYITGQTIGVNGGLYM